MTGLSSRRASGVSPDQRRLRLSSPAFGTEDGFAPGAGLPMLVDVPPSFVKCPSQRQFFFFGRDLPVLDLSIRLLYRDLFFSLPSNLDSFSFNDLFSSDNTVSMSS